MLNDGNGMMFMPNEAWRVEIKKRTHMLNQKYNALTDYQADEKKAMMKEILGEVGENVSFSGPITFHYGKHTKVGNNTFVNFNFTCQDDGEVTIGSHCDFGPNVTITTAMHPMLAGERLALKCPDGEKRRLCYALPVHIGDNCWICANVTILPGVTIGDGCVIGAGSVVTRSIPANSFAAGNPCRVIRTLGKGDSMADKPEILGDCSVIED